MLALRTALDGKRQKPLSGEEIRQVLQEIGSHPSLIQKSRDNLLLITGILKEVINPDLLLSVSIQCVRTYPDLLYPAIALRYGANRNLYVLAPELGPAHIMVYAVSILRNTCKDTNTILSTLLLLLLMCSQPNVSAFDLSRKEEIKGTPVKLDLGFVESISERLTIREVKPVGVIVNIPPPIISVSEWLKSQGLPGFEDPEKVLQQLPAETKVILGTYADLPDVVYANGLPKFQEILAARADHLIPGYIQRINDLKYDDIKQTRASYHGEIEGIACTIDAAYALAFKALLDAGIDVSYFSTNRLVLATADASRNINDGGFIMWERVKMLVYAASKGVKIDTFQLAIISTTPDGEGIVKEILEAYKQPQWKKVCSGPLPLTNEVKHLAYALNISPDQSKEAVCKQLGKMSEADATSLKQAAKLRHQTRVISGISTISDFIVGNTPAISCQNKTVMQTDPLEYNDAAMSFYKDNQGHVWCFTSDMFEGLLSNPINPYTQQPLSSAFQCQVRTQLEILKRLGIPVSSPLSTLAAIDSLNKMDSINVDESQYITSTISQAAKVACIDPKRLTMNVTDANNVLASIHMQQPYMLDASGKATLTPDHQLATLSRAAYIVIKDQPDMARIFFNAVKATSL